MPDGVNINLLLEMIDKVKTSLSTHDTAIALLQQEMGTQADAIEVLKKKVDKIWDKMLICMGIGIGVGFLIKLMTGGL